MASIKPAFKKNVILHFQPIEYYPPTQNLINNFPLDGIRLFVLTTFSSRIECFKKSKVKFLRLVNFENSSNSIIRNIKIIWFNIISVFQLIRIGPSSILVFETWSIFPAFIYKFIQPSVKLLVHFHEYTSPYQRKNNESKFFQVLWKIEKKILSRVEWISQTNMQRLELYKKDNMPLKETVFNVLPNYPPKAWLDFSSKSYEKNKSYKLVYVGSLSTSNMYLKELVDWIESKDGILTLDIYSINLNEDVRYYLEKKASQYSTIKSAVLYKDLPSVLSEYNAGLVIYNGGNLNFLYNAPNKLFEYWACGLDVWFSSDLITSKEYITNDVYPKVIEVDFKQLDKFNWEKAINRDGFKFQASPYCCETVLQNLYEKMIE